MRRASRCLGVMGSLLLASCGATPTEPVRLLTDITTQAEVYGPGSTVTFTLHNLTADTIRFSPCNWALQKRVLSQWVRVGSRAIGLGAALCVAPLDIAPDGSATYQIGLQTTLHPGEYRVVFLVNGGASEPGPWLQPSHPFEISGATAIAARME
jgi:hypothetical protein